MSIWWMGVEREGIPGKGREYPGKGAAVGKVGTLSIASPYLFK